MAGNRTRVNCLEGSYAHHYTTNAVPPGRHAHDAGDCHRLVPTGATPRHAAPRHRGRLPANSLRPLHDGLSPKAKANARTRARARVKAKVKAKAKAKAHWGSSRPTRAVRKHTAWPGGTLSPPDRSHLAPGPADGPGHATRAAGTRVAPGSAPSRQATTRPRMAQR